MVNIAKNSPELSTGTADRSEELILDTDAEFALLALGAELDAREDAASDGNKRRLDEHMDAAKNVTGGRGYEFGAVVDRGHLTRVFGGSAVSDAFGMAPRPYGMPYLGTRRGSYGNPYINRASVRY